MADRSSGSSNSPKANTNFENNTRTGMAVHSQDTETKPLLYKPDGTALISARAEFGFRPPQGK